MRSHLMPRPLPQPCLLGSGEQPPGHGSKRNASEGWGIGYSSLGPSTDWPWGGHGLHPTDSNPTGGPAPRQRASRTGTRWASHGWTEDRRKGCRVCGYSPTAFPHGDSRAHTPPSPSCNLLILIFSQVERQRKESRGGHICWRPPTWSLCPATAQPAVPTPTPRDPHTCPRLPAPPPATGHVHGSCASSEVYQMWLEDLGSLPVLLTHRP